MPMHAIMRTSPKGEAFVGTCRLCGQDNLKMEDARKECSNVRGLTQEEALLEVIDNKTNWDFSRVKPGRRMNYLLPFIIGMMSLGIVCLIIALRAPEWLVIFELPGIIWASWKLSPYLYGWKH